MTDVDPDRLLEHVLALTVDLTAEPAHHPAHGPHLAGHVAELHRYLSGGGRLPGPWAAAQVFMGSWYPEQCAEQGHDPSDHTGEADVHWHSEGAFCTPACPAWQRTEVEQ